MSASTTLLVSPDPSLVESVSGVIRSIADLRLLVLAEAEEACSLLERDGAALVLVHLPQSDPVDRVTRLLQVATASKRPVPVVIIGDRPNAGRALDLLRRGVVDYLPRPLDLGRLAYLADLLTVRARCEAGLTAAGEQKVEVLGKKDRFLYVRSAGMGRLMEQVLRVAPQETTLLLGGETGTGKTHLARLIHESSPRREEPFMVVNCGALSASLIESELFGHVKGAYTGADRDRAGKCADVGRGTLVLDEIDSLPLALQGKLLRVVEERVFEPVGSNKSQPMRARLIVASNRHLEQEVAAGRFRQDLYYRLNVVGFHLPSLREQPEVIGFLVDHFLAEFATRNGRPVRGMTGQARQALLGHGWPGNIRELRNVIERAVALCPGELIHRDDLPEALRQNQTASSPPPGLSFEGAEHSTLVRTKEEAEAARITEALVRNNNNRLRAAAELGISRMTLYTKLRRYGLIDVT